MCNQSLPPDCLAFVLNSRDCGFASVWLPSPNDGPTNAFIKQNSAIGAGVTVAACHLQCNR